MKESISKAFTSTMKNKDGATQNEVQQLVIQIVNAFVSNDLTSVETEKLPSSDNDDASFQTAHDRSASTTTVRYNDDDDDIKVDKDGNYYFLNSMSIFLQ